jgi:hypothetical protein
MAQKPKIQYIGQFYVHGSEARALALEEERRQAKARRLARLQQVELIYVDPVAVVSIVVSFIMLATMLTGALALKEDWAAYEEMATYVSYLNKENAKLEKEYREGYDLADIESKALALGLVPREQLENHTVTVTLPVEAPQISRVDQIRQYFEDMFA